MWSNDVAGAPDEDDDDNDDDDAGRTVGDVVAAIEVDAAGAAGSASDVGSLALGTGWRAACFNGVGLNNTRGNGAA